MANLIIGDTTQSSTRIWIRGDKHCSHARVRVESCDKAHPYIKELQPESLSPSKDFTEVISFDGLHPDTQYRVDARFASSDDQLNNPREACHLQGQFRTFPDPKEYSGQPFSFLHGSCNLSVVSLTNVGGLVLGALGLLAATQSLKRQPTRGSFKWLLRLLLGLGNAIVKLVYLIYYVFLFISFVFRYTYWFLSRTSTKPKKPKFNNKVSLLYAVFYLVYKLTEFKQPKPLLPSPFDELCKLVATATIAFHSGQTEPSVGDMITGKASDATGILAYYPTLTSGSWKENNAAGILVLTQVSRTFERGEILEVGSKTVGTITSSPVMEDQPAFMIHAGDQIYFDFPFPQRRPELAAYRQAYRETWSEDPSMRHFLAQCPHFMILDDHEIVDGFANDLVPGWWTFESGRKKPSIGETITGEDSGATGKVAASPALTSGSWEAQDAAGQLVLKGVSGGFRSGESLKVGSEVVGISTSMSYKPEDYLKPATDAYKEYVHARQPKVPKEPKENDNSTLYYQFHYGTTYFFVLDTRTRRCRSKQEMIDQTQLKALTDWLLEHKEDLKFIVSSVPFVAEVRSTVTKNDSQPATEPGVSATNKLSDNGFSIGKADEKDDKWSGKPFKAQRDQIIKFIHENDIQRLVFLVGDMHCSYHATMRIGEHEKRVTIHELAGGPIRQLQFARRKDFHDHYRGITGGKDPLQFTTWLQQFHDSSSGVMRITVSPGASPEVLWKVERTSTKFLSRGEKDGMTGPRALSGRISFRRYENGSARL